MNKVVTFLALFMPILLPAGDNASFNPTEHYAISYPADLMQRFLHESRENFETQQPANLQGARISVPSQTATSLDSTLDQNSTATNNNNNTPPPTHPASIYFISPFMSVFLELINQEKQVFCSTTMHIFCDKNDRHHFSCRQKKHLRSHNPVPVNANDEQKKRSLHDSYSLNVALVTVDPDHLTALILCDILKISQHSISMIRENKPINIALSESNAQNYEEAIADQEVPFALRIRTQKE